MIEIEKADKGRHCNCCYSQNDLHEVHFMAQNRGTTVALCSSCIDELHKKIHEEKENTDER